MTSYTNNLTSQKIIAVLSKAGFMKSTSSTTSVRGWYNITRGYEVREQADTVYGTHSYNNKMYVQSKTIRGWTIEYTNGTTIMGALKDDDKITKLVYGYYQALCDADIICEYRDSNGRPIVWVPMQDKPEAPKVKKTTQKLQGTEAELRTRVYHKLHAAGLAKEVKIELRNGGLWITARGEENAERTLRDAFGILCERFAIAYADEKRALMIAAM